LGLSRLWTKEEDEIAIYCLGRMTYDAIGKKLGRTAQGVEKRMIKLGYSSTRECCPYLTMRQFQMAIRTDHHIVTRWIKKHGMPIKNMRIAYKRDLKYKSLFVDPEEFWIWAEQNKSLVDFSRIEKHALLPEPDWVEEERIKGPISKIREWTAEDDQELFELYYKQCNSQKEVARIMGRSHTVIGEKVALLRNTQKKKHTG
jgi:hypothetical protein